MVVVVVVVVVVLSAVFVVAFSSSSSFLHFFLSDCEAQRPEKMCGFKPVRQSTVFAFRPKPWAGRQQAWTCLINCCLLVEIIACLFALFPWSKLPLTS